MKQAEAIVVYTSEEQGVMRAARSLRVAYGAISAACRSFTGDVPGFLIKIRTINGVLKSVRDMRTGTSAEKEAATLFDSISTAFRRVAEEKLTPREREAKAAAGKKEAVKKVAAAKTEVLVALGASPKAVISLCRVQVTALGKREKAGFDIPRAIAAWKALEAVYTK